MEKENIQEMVKKYVDCFSTGLCPIALVINIGNSPVYLVSVNDVVFWHIIIIITK